MSSPRSLLTFCLLALLIATGARAQSFESSAGQAILMDHATGTVLFDKNADERIPPASLAKLMTMEVVFDRLRSGILSVEDEVTISEDAWRRGGEASGGSTMFLRPRSRVKVGDLIRGVIVQSGNDASIALAEHVAGNEATFARLMNERAAAIGMNDSTFRNATGLPDPEQRVTLRDMVRLARHLFETYPDYYAIYSEREFEWNRIRQPNRNPLLDADLGADGLKTGYTEESGYAIVASATQDGRRLFLAVSGLESSRQRASEATKLLRWGWRAFEPRDLFEAGASIASVRLYGGTIQTVPVTTSGPVTIFLPIAGRSELTAEVAYDGPVPAPVRKGDQIAVLRVLSGETVTQETPLIAAESVDRGPIYLRALDAARELVQFWN